MLVRLRHAFPSDISADDAARRMLRLLLSTSARQAEITGTLSLNKQQQIKLLANV